MIVRVKEEQELKARLKERRLVVYGMGTMGKTIATWLDEQGISYVFADQKANEKQLLTDKIVVTPEQVYLEYKDANILISTNLYYDEIKAALLQKNFEEKQILSYTLFLPDELSWKDLEQNIDWNLMRPSVEILSKWIVQGDASVADYGAGQMYLKSLLCPETRYYPVDYLKRFEQTIVCDLNQGIFPDLNVDVSVLNGVLEFLLTAEKLLRHVSTHTKKKVIISYMTLDKFSNKEARRASGYVSDLTEQQIIQILTENGFKLNHKQYDPLDATDTIYLFERKM